MYAMVVRVTKLFRGSYQIANWMELEEERPKRSSTSSPLSLILAPTSYLLSFPCLFLFFLYILSSSNVCSRFHLGTPNSKASPPNYQPTRSRYHYHRWKHWVGRMALSLSLVSSFFVQLLIWHHFSTAARAAPHSNPSSSTQPREANTSMPGYQ